MKPLHIRQSTHLRRVPTVIAGIPSEGVMGVPPMGAHAWALHVVGTLQGADSHRRLLAAPARRPFAAARRHVIADPPEDDEDVDRAPGQRTTTAARRTRKAEP